MKKMSLLAGLMVLCRVIKLGPRDARTIGSIDGFRRFKQFRNDRRLSERIGRKLHADPGGHGHTVPTHWH
jgi:hypothetical protein